LTVRALESEVGPDLIPTAPEESFAPPNSSVPVVATGAERYTFELTLALLCEFSGLSLPLLTVPKPPLLNSI